MNSLATTRISPKRQITLPIAIVKKLGLTAGEFLHARVHQGDIVLTPQKLVPKGQAWFWTKEWQEKERHADADIKSGRVATFTNVEDLIVDLHQ